MINKMIQENQSMKYKIMVGNRTIDICSSKEIANSTILNLPADLREQASIVPVTTEGKQLLNEANFV